jgi:hypothetical protein
VSADPMEAVGMFADLPRFCFTDAVDRVWGNVHATELKGYAALNNRTFIAT